jgi:DNA-binding HxlR family transcriptional regulator
MAFNNKEEIMKLISLITGDKMRASIAVTLETRGPTPYNELKKNIEHMEKEISDGRFNWHLKQLESNNIIKRTDNGYALTDKGKEAITIILKAFKSYRE